MTEMFIGELRAIADIIEAVQALEKKLVENSYGLGDITVEFPEEFNFRIINANNELMGYVGYTEHGIIGYISEDKDD